MGLVQYAAAALLLSARLVLVYPAVDATEECVWCPPGEYQESCTKCAPCAARRYTSVRNQEDSCHRCFADCRPDYNLRVERACTRTSNTKCVCKPGYTCTDKYDALNCRLCEKSQGNAARGKRGHAPASASSGRDGGVAEPCLFPKCAPQTVPPRSNNTGTASSPLAAILSPVVIMGCVALVILLCLRRPGDEICFKQALVKLRNEGGCEAPHKSRESTQVPRDSFGAKQQPSPLSVANLGSVHVHNPGTVVFSLLSQFGAAGDGRTAEKASGDEDGDEDRDGAARHHRAASPSIHLSEEERSGESDSALFPSQEQGKDCHVSKEEEL
ncbi:tumor necrosis factor receptor superfamily member 14 isoform X2 [Betta splendens]|nr:tumor necrosis factor receptor superfamily member 14 isoform X2 [Betta splendens]